MPAKILIIWPNRAAAEQLWNAILDTEADVAPEIIDEYPAARDVAGLVEREAGIPFAAIVGLSDDPQGAETLESLSAAAPAGAVMAAAEQLDAQLVRAALRAGASEFLAPPYDSAELKRSLRGVADAGRSEAPGTKLCFLPARAGDGASLLAMHIADFLSRSVGQAMLLLDADVDGGSTSFRMGLNPTYTLADAIASRDVLDDVWEKLASRWGATDVLPGPDRDGVVSHEDQLQIPAVAESAGRVYPYVISDLPAALSETTELLLLDASTISLVCSPHLTSLHLARRKARRLDEIGIPQDAVRLVLNRVAKGQSVRRQDVEQIVGLPVFASIAEDEPAASQAAFRGELIDPKSSIGQALSGLSHDLAGIKDEPKTEERGGWSRIFSLG